MKTVPNQLKTKTSTIPVHLPTSNDYLNDFDQTITIVLWTVLCVFLVNLFIHSFTYLVFIWQGKNSFNLFLAHISFSTLFPYALNCLSKMAIKAYMGINFHYNKSHLVTYECTCPGLRKGYVITDYCKNGTGYSLKKIMVTIFHLIFLSSLRLVF